MRGLVVVLVALLLLAAACNGGSRAQESNKLVIYAAASLEEPFEQMAKAVEHKHPDLDIKLKFGASSRLAPRVAAGARADLLATASVDTMQLAIDGGAVTEDPMVFASNQLEIAVPAGNPAEVDGLADLADPGVELALCAPEVPCGAAAQNVLQSAGVMPEAATFEAHDKAVLRQVVLNKVDAGLVYRSDVDAERSQVTGIEFDESDEAVNEYAVAPVADSPNPTGAEAFLDFLRSLRGREILRDAGFDAA